MDTPDGQPNPAEPVGPAPKAPTSAASRSRDHPPGWRPPTALARLQALFPSADHTDFPTPTAHGVGDPATGEGWLTDLQHYITTTHDRACEQQAETPPPPEPPPPHYGGVDDPPPF